MFHKHQMHVHLEDIVSLGDQPKRQHMNYIMGGNSKLSARFCYCGNIDAIQLHVPSCKRCLKNLRGNALFLLESYKCE